MRLKNCAGRHNENPSQEKKKQKAKGFHEAVSEIRKERQEAEMERRKALRAAEAKVAEDEVARMTFGPSYSQSE